MKQLTTNDQVQNLIQIRKSLSRGKAGNLAENRAFLDFLAIQQQMTAEIEATWAIIRERMEQYDIKKIDGDWGNVQFVPYPTYQAAGKVAPRFFKQSLDGSEIKHYMKNHAGQLPSGVAMKTVLQFKKSIKKAVQ